VAHHRIAAVPSLFSGRFFVGFHHLGQGPRGARIFAGPVLYLFAAPQYCGHAANGAAYNDTRQFNAGFRFLILYWMFPPPVPFNAQKSGRTPAAFAAGTACKPAQVFQTNPAYVCMTNPPKFRMETRPCFALQPDRLNAPFPAQLL
jgi:hypothetical protein